ncbi:MAG: hypothetical protein QGI09_11145 [Dehalococcoidia bacterium]|nr:hypothetical protein [Dehalococcoidia bacterium]
MRVQMELVAARQEMRKLQAGTPGEWTVPPVPWKYGGHCRDTEEDGEFASVAGRYAVSRVRPVPGRSARCFRENDWGRAGWER